MRRSIIALPVLFAALSSVGCAGTAVRPADLKQASARPSLRLARHYSYVIQQGNPTAWTLVAGEYRAQYEDARGGTYYRGPPHCLWQGDAAGHFGQRLQHCGIYIPASATEPWQVFMVYGDYREAGPVGKASPATPDEAGRSDPDAFAVVGAGTTVADQGGKLLGASIANAFIAADNGKLWILPRGAQPDQQELRAAFVPALDRAK